MTTHYTQIKTFDGSRNAFGQQTRVEDTRAAALDFRRQMLAGPKVRYFESFDLIKLVYPCRYGLRNAYSAERLNAFLHIMNRVYVVQYDTPSGLKTLLVSPSDHERGGETPYFRRLQDATPTFILDRIIERYAKPHLLFRTISINGCYSDIPADRVIIQDHLHFKYFQNACFK